MMCYYGYRTDNGQGMRQLECVTRPPARKRDTPVKKPAALSTLTPDDLRAARDMIVLHGKTLRFVCTLFNVYEKSMKKKMLEVLGFNYSEHFMTHKPWAIDNAAKARKDANKNRRSSESG